jgi:hypothetical protein
MTKQRIITDINRVKTQIRHGPIHAKRQFVGHHMNVMPTLSKVDRQFGGDGTTAAVGGIANNGETHAVPLGMMAKKNASALDSSAHSWETLETEALNKRNGGTEESQNTLS